MFACVHLGSNSGADGILLLRVVENSRGGHDEREIDIERSSYCRGAQYYESVGLLPNGAGEEHAPVRASM